MAPPNEKAPDLDRQKIERFLAASGIAFDAAEIRPTLKCPLTACSGRAILNRDTDTVSCLDCGCVLDIFDIVLLLHGADNETAARRIINQVCDGSTGEKEPKKKARKKKAQPPAREGWETALSLGKEGEPLATDSNLYEIFLNHPNWTGALGLNARSLEIVALRDTPIELKAGEKFRDHHGYQAASWCYSAMGIPRVKAMSAMSAMISAAHKHPFDPVRDWLDGLEWDNTQRLDLWLPHLTGCDSTPYTRDAGAKTLIGAVARAYEPGAKVDTVLVLCGPQGTLKSTLLRELAVRPEWFTDHVPDVGSKDAALQLCGPWILEFAELDAITGKAESERVKRWLSQTVDRFRPPYARNVVDVPRRVVFTGTSNLFSFLRDETGGRRYLPIQIREIDINGMIKVREQLWAEARHRYLARETWWLEGDALNGALAEQEDRRVSDPWEAEITKWIDMQANLVYLTSREVLTTGLKVDVARQTKTDLDRVGRVFSSVLGWSRGKRRENGRVISVWYPPPKDGEQKVINLKAAPSDVDDQGRLGREY
jgi:predicted P-loop ATPase